MGKIFSRKFLAMIGFFTLVGVGKASGVDLSDGDIQWLASALMVYLGGQSVVDSRK